MHGVSTRSVDDLVKAMGGDTGISKSEVSRICQALDEPLTAFRSRPLDHVRFPYVYLDATYCKARVNHHIVSQAVVIATGITEDGNREVLGLMVGSAWQWCRVHLLRNVFNVIDKESGEMVAATIRTIFTQPTADLMRTQLDTVADMLGQQFPKVRAMLLGAKEDLTAFADFPRRHWKKIQSTNPLERINREIKRRIVVQVFPNPPVLERLVTAVLFEMHDEWIAFLRRYLPEASMDAHYSELPESAPAQPNATNTPAS